jgi:hypothetical protein
VPRRAAGSHGSTGRGVGADFGATGRRDLEPDREQLPNAQDHQEHDKTYCQRLSYFGDVRLNRGSDHLPNPSLTERSDLPVLPRDYPHRERSGICLLECVCCVSEMATASECLWNPMACLTATVAEV